MNAVPLEQFLDRVSALWKSYQDVGPGQVNPSLWTEIPELTAHIERELIDGDTRILQAVRQVSDLSERCACRSEGLCFITGEAGLIPRRDLLELMESSLRILREQAARM
jgi:hypothetical protein